MDLILVIQVLALAGFSLLAYSLRALDARGSAASFVLGGIIVLAGGVGWLILMAVFTGMAYVVTRLGIERKASLGLAEKHDGERGWRNVVGNGAAPGLAALAALIWPEAGTLAFAAAVAAIMTDTMGSEVGVLSERARLILPPFRRVPAGRNGAVSLLGQSASLVGAATIALAAVWLLGIDSDQAAWTAAAGFAGGQLDSVLGATLERDPDRPRRPLGKQSVNFLAAVIPATVVFVATSL